MSQIEFNQKIIDTIENIYKENLELRTEIFKLKQDNMSLRLALIPIFNNNSSIRKLNGIHDIRNWILNTENIIKKEEE